MDLIKALTVMIASFGYPNATTDYFLSQPVLDLILWRSNGPVTLPRFSLYNFSAHKVHHAGKGGCDSLLQEEEVKSMCDVYWRRLVKNIGWANQNIWGKVIKSAKCMGFSQLLGGKCPGCPQSQCLW